MIYFKLLNKSRDPKVLGYTLTYHITQTLEGGRRRDKLNDKTPIAYGKNGM